MFTFYFNNHKYVWAKSFLVSANIFLGGNLPMPNIKKAHLIQRQKVTLNKVHLGLMLMWPSFSQRLLKFIEKQILHLKSFPVPKLVWDRKLSCDCEGK